MKEKPSVLSPSKEPPPSAQYQSDLSSAKTMLIILGLPSNFSHVISLQKWREMVRIFYIIWFIFWCWMERTRISGGGHLISVGFGVAAGQLRHSAAAILPFQLHFCNTDAAALHIGNMAPLHFANMAAYKLHFVSPTNCRQLTVAILEEVIWPVIRMFSNFNFRAKRKGLNVAEASQSQPVSQPASQQLGKHECFTVAATGAADSLSSTAAHYWQPSLNGYFTAAEFTAKTRLWICHVIPMVQFSGLAIQDFKFKTSAASCSPFANHETHWLVFFQPHPVQPSSPILQVHVISTVFWIAHFNPRPVVEDLSPWYLGPAMVGKKELFNWPEVVLVDEVAAGYGLEKGY